MVLRQCLDLLKLNKDRKILVTEPKKLHLITMLAKTNTYYTYEDDKNKSIKRNGTIYA